MKFSFKEGKGIFTLITLIVYLAVVFILPLYLGPNIDVLLRLNILIYTSLTAAICLCLYSIFTKIGVEKEAKRTGILLSIALGILGFISLMVMQGVLNLVLTYLAKIYNFSTVSENTSNIAEIIKKLPLFAVFVTITGPILEELAFRKAIFGYLYDSMKGSSKVVRFLVPAIVTGILFAIPHDGVSPIMIIYIVMSLIFSAMYVYTGRIMVPIIAHILMNTLVVAIQTVVQQGGANEVTNMVIYQLFSAIWS